MAHTGTGNATWADYPSTSTLITAATLENIENLLDRLAAPPVYAGHQLTTQNFTNGVAAAITFDGETIDTHNGHSTSTNPSRYTVPTGWGGVWFVSGKAMLNNFTGRRALWIYKNGAAVAGGLAIVSPETTNANAGLQDTVFSSRLVTLAAADYIELFLYQDSGGTLATSANSTPFDFTSAVDIFYVRP